MGGKKKVLIAYANAGAGHRKAATAVESGFRELNRNDIEVKVIDTLDYSTPFLKKGYPSTYLFLVNRIPTLWGLGYYLFDARIFYKLIVAPARRINNGFHCKGLVDFLKRYSPDIVINTHFLGSEVMGDMRRRGMLKSTKLITVVTDYFMHSFWVEEAIDYYCVAQKESKEHLVKRGIPAEKIRVFGVPIDRIFAVKKDKKELCTRLNLRDDCRSVLIGSGGFGVGPIKQLVKELGGIKEIQILVVCGKNPKLHKEISELAESLEAAVKAYGFVDNMDELMEVSDLIVTKSGGMTSSEAMAKGLPMVINSAIPGQEARNCKFLVMAGAAMQASTVRKTKEAILEILDSKEKLSQLEKRIDAIRKPDSSLDIARFALSL